MKEGNKGQLFRKYFLLTVVALGAGVIYKVAYMREAFYDAMLAGFQITNTQLGEISSLYGTIALICYVPGGILADKIHYKYLLCSSFIGTGALTLWCATMPGYGTVKLIFALMAIFTILTYWSAFVKTVRALGDDSEQGRMFGLAEGIRGVSGIVASFIVMALIELAANSVLGMQYMLVFYGVIYVVVGIITFVLLPKPEKRTEESAKEAFSLKEFVGALKCKGTWIVCAIVFFWYVAYSATSYSIPYLTNVFGVSSVLVGSISIIRAYAIGILAAPFAGFAADKIKSCSRALAYFAIAGFIIIAGLLFIPTKSSWITIAIVVTLLFSFVIFSARGIYFSPMAEAGIPFALTGAASGIISIVGYSPDMFIYNIMGKWLDKYPGAQGYRYIFILTAVSMIAAFAVCWYAYRYGKKIARKKENENLKEIKER